MIAAPRFFSFGVPPDLGKPYSRKETTQKYLQRSSWQRSTAGPTAVGRAVAPTARLTSRRSPGSHLAAHMYPHARVRLHPHVKHQRYTFCTTRALEAESQKVGISVSHFLTTEHVTALNMHLPRAKIPGNQIRALQKSACCECGRASHSSAPPSSFRESCKMCCPWTQHREPLRGRVNGTQSPRAGGGGTLERLSAPTPQDAPSDAH